MIRPRIIPCLLIHKSGLVKTIAFDKPTYVGDPINAVRIFNEKEVDELIVLDIDATTEGREPNYKAIRDMATECRMPLCYGGGIKSVEQAARIVQSGVEKVALSSAAVSDISIVSSLARHLGSQSVVVVLDVSRRHSNRAEVVTHNGRKPSGLSPVDFSRQLESAGAGEIVLNSIDRDGRMSGYDLELVRDVRAAISLPMTVLGGAATLRDLQVLIQEFGIIGAAAGSLFVFKGAYRAVLINYPSTRKKQELIASAQEVLRHS